MSCTLLAGGEGNSFGKTKVLLEVIYRKRKIFLPIVYAGEIFRYNINVEMWLN